jgi:predicted O-methyltransferase YrrM
MLLNLVFITCFKHIVYETPEEIYRKAAANLPGLLKSINERNPFFVPGDEGSLGIDGSMLPNQLLKLGKMMNIREDDVVLDFGCNNGYSTAILASLQPFMMLALEIKKNHFYQALMTQLRLSSTRHRLRHVSFIHGDGTKVCESFSPASICEFDYF